MTPAHGPHAPSSGGGQPAPPGAAAEVELVDAQRLISFSDGVLAIAITLLALSLPIPAGVTDRAVADDLGAHADDYLAFLISFLVIGNYWFAHHRVFGQIAGLAGRLSHWNMLWLLTIVVMPFATRVLTSDGAFPVRFGMYALVQATAGAAFLMMLREADRWHLMRPSGNRTAVPANYRRSAIVIIAFLASIPVAFFTEWAYLCWVAIPVASGLLARRTRARARRAAAGSDG